ncbi:DDB1- and CUL4-associated factor 8 [Uranotaenia lowii]|uniref:DDB1- and CUL4-associated factor 8 n=1 Tax=Uranotaenia lowii TaxID=190385 RepID=UPI0024787373|nr:DDB1- and CUL4-associated factor 8 [Uranotaenia lowii]
MDRDESNISSSSSSMDGDEIRHLSKKSKLSNELSNLDTNSQDMDCFGGEPSTSSSSSSGRKDRPQLMSMDQDSAVTDENEQQEACKSNESPNEAFNTENSSNNSKVDASSSSGAAVDASQNDVSDRPAEAALLAAPAANDEADELPVRRRNRFRGRNYRLRSDSSASDEQDEDSIAHQADQVAGMLIRRLVDTINQETDARSDANEEASNDDNNDDDDNESSSETSSADSDDSDSSPMVSNDDDDDDDDDDSLYENVAEGTPAESIDVSTLPFMQTANLKNNWNWLRELQMRSQGLSYRTRKSVGGAGYNSNQFQFHSYGSKYVVERLTKLHCLEKHDGCVNSLNFNIAGTLLASGSDDLDINLWNWQTNKLVKTIVSGHKSNVFQTKFIEASGYKNEIEIVSTGRDGQVIHNRVCPSGSVKRTMLFKQTQPIHKIAIPARSPYEFLTACEDGVVKSYDLRDNVGKKITNVKRRLYSIATHPFDHEFCVSGNDESVRVYDRRQSSKLLKQFYAAHINNKKQYITVTCAVYNNSGSEILASYSEEDVFLFDNVHHETGKYLHRYSGHCNVKTIKGVNFFGPNSEYVVSGSDCGNIFIWDKESEIIVNWMKGDDAGVVNCLEPHPEFPILATSGLDSDIKIWVPKGGDDEHEVPHYARESLEKCVKRNLRIRRVRRCHSLSEGHILDFLLFSQGFRNGRQRLGLDDGSSDGDNPAAGAAGGAAAASAAAAAPARRTRRREAGNDDDDDRMILQCNPS